MNKKIAVHLDFKGLVPKFERLLKMLHLFKAAGYNAILVEWEGAYPWSVDERFRASNGYTKDQVNTFLEKAGKLSLEVIPLVQTLGHMEPFLSIDDYRYLREVEDNSDCLNPLADGAQDFTLSLIKDVLDVCKETKYFHLGGDEAWNFGKNTQTSEYISFNGKADLYLRNIMPLVEYLNSVGITPILWHDMMSDWDLNILSQLKNKVQLMVWGYNDILDKKSVHYCLDQLKKIDKTGIKMWGALAFKGADGQSKDLPELSSRYKNAEQWSGLSKQYDFEGMVATGWNRYSSHSAQIEPIEVTLDSLINTCRILYKGDTSDLPEYGSEILAQQHELDQFLTAKTVMKNYSNIRNEILDLINELWLQIYLEEMKPENKKSKISDKLVRDIIKKIPDFDCYEKNAKSVIKKLIKRECVDEYFKCRRMAIEGQLEILNNIVKSRMASINLVTENYSVSC